MFNKLLLHDENWRLPLSLIMQIWSLLCVSSLGTLDTVNEFLNSFDIAFPAVNYRVCFPCSILTLCPSCCRACSRRLLVIRPGIERNWFFGGKNSQTTGNPF